MDAAGDDGMTYSNGLGGGATGLLAKKKTWETWEGSKRFKTRSEIE